MFSRLFAKSYELNNGVCSVDGVVQSSTTACDDVIKGFLGILLAIVITMIIISIIFLVFWIITLIHAIKNEDVENRTFWIIAHVVSLFLAFAWLITIIYYFVVYRPYKKTSLEKNQQ